MVLKGLGLDLRRQGDGAHVVLDQRWRQPPETQRQLQIQVPQIHPITLQTTDHHRIVTGRAAGQTRANTRAHLAPAIDSDLLVANSAHHVPVRNLDCLT